jgi:hypothetical protein
VEGVGFLALLSGEGRGSAAQRARVAVWCAVTWFQVLYALRGFELFGPRILPILNAVKDTAAFFIVVAFCLLGFTHAYYVLGTREGPSLPYAAFLPTFRLGVTGDYDMHELSGVDPVLVKEDEGIWAPEDPDPLDDPLYWSVQVWFFGTGIVITILMMNILVGILGTNYQHYKDQSQDLFVRERARIVMVLSARPYAQGTWKKMENGEKNERGVFLFHHQAKN